MLHPSIGRNGVLQQRPMTDRQSEVANVLSEEAMEVGVEASKLKRCGLDFCRTDVEASPTVLQRFTKEMVDLLMIVDEARDAGLIDTSLVARHIEDKRDRLSAWTHTCGLLSDYPLARMLIDGGGLASNIRGPIRTSVNLNLDLDGTLFDFDGTFFRLFGVSPGSLSRDHKWGKISSVPRFFAELDLLPGAVEFMQRIAPLGPRILTGCPRTHYQRAAMQKIEAVRAAFGHLEVLPVQGSRNKYLFMQNKGDILLDDREDVCEAWSKAGGYAILFKGDYEDAYQKIILHLRAMLSIEC